MLLGRILSSSVITGHPALLQGARSGTQSHCQAWLPVAERSYEVDVSGSRTSRAFALLAQPLACQVCLMYDAMVFDGMFD